MQITVTVPDELAREAQERGVSVETYAEEVLSLRNCQPIDDTETRRKAVEAMLRFTEEYGFTLGENVTIKDLINEGRKR